MRQKQQQIYIDMKEQLQQQIKALEEKMYNLEFNMIHYSGEGDWAMVSACSDELDELIEEREALKKKLMGEPRDAGIDQLKVGEDE